MAGACECGNEPSVSIKCGELLDLQTTWLASQGGLCSMEQGSNYKHHNDNAVDRQLVAIAVIKLIK